MKIEPNLPSVSRVSERYAASVRGRKKVAYYPEEYEDWEEVDDWVPVHGQDLAYWNPDNSLVALVLKGGRRYIYRYQNRDNMPRSARAAEAIIKELGLNIEKAVKASPDWELDG